MRSELEPTAEEAIETQSKRVENSSVDGTPAENNQYESETKNYLNPNLFDDVKTVLRSEMTDEKSTNQLTPDQEVAYSKNIGRNI